MDAYNSLRNFYKRKMCLGCPISIRRVVLPEGTLGTTECCNGKFIVKIDNKISEMSAIETLIHEMGHCIAWEKSIGHGVVWGAAYSKAYKLYLEWIKEYEEFQDQVAKNAI